MNKEMKKWLKIAMELMAVGGILAIVCAALGASFFDHSSEAGKVNGTETVWDFSEYDITRLDLEVEAGKLVVSEGDDFQIRVENTRDSIECSVKNQTLVVEEERGFWDWNFGDADDGPILCLTVPKGSRFETVEISVGAGSASLGVIRADQVIIDVNAGSASAEILETRKAILNVDAGSFRCDSLTASESCEIDVDAGSVKIYDGSCSKNVTIDVDAGAAIYEGTIAGDWKAVCDAGSISMILSTRETDYDYIIECDLGKITVGEHIYDTAEEELLKNGGDYTAVLDCSVGKITVEFAP